MWAVDRFSAFVSILSADIFVTLESTADPSSASPSASMALHLLLPFLFDWLERVYGELLFCGKNMVFICSVCFEFSEDLCKRIALMGFKHDEISNK